MAPRKRRLCRPTLVSSFTIAPAAARRCGKARGLLHILFLWFGAMSADSRLSVWVSQARTRAVCVNGAMTDDVIQSSRDWLRNPRTNLLAWWLPQAVIVAGLFVPVAARATLWSCADLDGDRLHPECQAMRSHPLPLHRPILSHDDSTNVWAKLRLPVRGPAWLANIGAPYLARKQGPVVGDRAGMG